MTTSEQAQYRRLKPATVATARDLLVSPTVLARGLDQTYRVRPHSRMIGDAMAGLNQAAYKRLMIFVPPQLGKSTIANEWGSFWWLCLHPTHRVISTSYGDDLARMRGNRVKSLVEEHGWRFGLEMNPTFSAQQFWKLRTGGGMRSVSMGSGITGHSAELLIVDDPHKDRADAESHRSRENVYDWWSSTGKTRLQPGRPAVLIMCIVASMRILTGRGTWVPISDIRAGDTVVSLAEDGRRLATSKVLGQRLSGVDETVTVRTDRLELRVNRAHPFAVLNPERKRPSSTAIRWVQAGDLKPGDIAVTAKTMPGDFTAADVLPDGTPVDERLAWLLGMLLGDGWVTTHKRKNQRGAPTSYAVCCARTKSEKPHKADLNDRLRAALEAFSRNRVYETKFGYFRTDWNAGGRLLTEMGYGKGAHNKRVPDVVWGWSAPLRRAFIRGYAEADGALQQPAGRARADYETWRIVSANRGLLSDIRDLALTCGLRPTTVFSGKPKLYQPPNSSAPVMSVLHSVGISFTHGEAEGNTLVCDRNHANPAELRYERIRSVEDGLALPVYDLMVEATESFVAEGFVVHNTRWHPEDLAGRLLEQEGRLEDGGLWKVLHLPAIADPKFGPDPLGRAPGDPLPHHEIPLRDTVTLRAHWAEVKRTSTVRDWASMQQGDPQPQEGCLVSYELLRQIREYRDISPAQKAAVAIDPSGGGRDLAGIVAGHLGADHRMWITHDRSLNGPSSEWSKVACELAAEIDAQLIFVETNYGGDMATLTVHTAWDKLKVDHDRQQQELAAQADAEGRNFTPAPNPYARIKPAIESITARKGKMLRAEEAAQLFKLDQVRLGSFMPELEQEWATHQASSPDSPGRIDASVILTHGFWKHSGIAAIGTAVGRSKDGGTAPKGYDRTRIQR